MSAGFVFTFLSSVDFLRLPIPRLKAIAFLPNATIDERVAQLKKICHSESEETYNRTLTDSEIEREKTVQMEYNHRTNEIKVLENKMKRIKLND